MSWLWGPATNPQYEELVEKACSPLNLPYPQSEDMSTNLEITDMIRSKAVLPKPAMQSLKRRVASKNGRVQMYALGVSSSFASGLERSLTIQLIDTCIKNGGDHFLAEIASKEFVDEMSGVIKSSSTPAEVNQMALRLFQEWALAFKSKPNLSFLSDVYDELKSSGVSFPPPPSEASSHLLTTTTAPTWVDSDVCMRCRSAFTFTNRKHHCRNCGLVFDQACSSRMMPLPKFGIAEEVRVCEGCWIKAGGGKEQNGCVAPLNLSKLADISPAPAVPGRTRRSKAEFDADLQRAIELSLAESTPGGSALIGSEPPLRTSNVEDDDEQLRLAIEASLREMENRPSAPEGGEEPEYKPLPTFDLAPRETETILTFSNTMDQMAAYGERDLRRFPHAHVLAEQAYQLGGKLQRNAEEKATKQQMLSEMQAKLSHAVALYGQILDGQQAYTAQQLQEQQQRKYQQHQAQLQQQQPYGYGTYSPYQPAYPSYTPQPVYSPPPQQVHSGPSVYPSMPSISQQAPYQYVPPQPYQNYGPAYAQQNGPVANGYHTSQPATAVQQQPQASRQVSYAEPSAQSSAPPPIDIASHPSSSPKAHASSLPRAPVRQTSYASSPQATAPLGTSPTSPISPQPDHLAWNTIPSAPTPAQPEQVYAHPAQSGPTAQKQYAQPNGINGTTHARPSAPPAQAAQAAVYNASSFPILPSSVFPDAPISDPTPTETKEAQRQQPEEALLIEL